MYQEVNLTGNRLASKKLTGIIGIAGGGTKDYNLLNNKPSINGITLSGNKTGFDLGLVDIAKVSSAIVLGRAKGASPSFYADIDNIPVNSLVAEIVASQDGYTDVIVTRSGKNLWKFGDVTSSENDIPFSLKAGTYNLSGTRSGTGTPSISIRFYYADGTSTVCQLTGTNSYSNSVTLTADVVKINKYISADSLVNVQMEKGSSKTTYEAYKGTTYTIALGETLTQGGSLNVTTGLLTRTDTTTKQLSQTEVRTLLGENNIYANSGDVDILYYVTLGAMINE